MREWVFSGSLIFSIGVLSSFFFFFSESSYGCEELQEEGGRWSMKKPSMATELQYAVDLLTTSKRRKVTCDSVRNSGSFEDFKKILLKQKLTSTDHQLQLSMDRMLEQSNRESLRTTMLKQEEIFKEQVHQLHRLYNIQKMMMAELRNNKAKLQSMSNPSPRAIRVRPDSINMDNQTRLWSTRTGFETSTSPLSNLNQSPQSQTYPGQNFHQLFSVRTDPSSQAQSSTSCSRDEFRMPKGFDLGRSIEEQAGSSSMRSRDQRDVIDGDSDVELTLSIGFGSSTTSKKKPKSCQSHSKLELTCSESNFNHVRHKGSSTSIRTDRGEECSDRSNSTDGTANATFDREKLQQPPWLFQTLSLNRT